jgi:uncharacterized membrane protein (UPF0127 family)
MRIAVVRKNNETVIDEVELADSFIRRFCGLMYRKTMAKNHGLLLNPCNQIHTFGMKFAIDALFLSKDYVIIKIEESIKPGKVCKTVNGAHFVLELCGGVAKEAGLSVGDKLEIR